MAARKESITVSGNKITINNLVVEDEETADVLKEESDNNKREEYIINSIKIGANVQRNQIPIEKMDYVKKEFTKLVYLIGENTREWEDSITDNLNKSLDPSDEKSHIYKLRRDLLDSIDAIGRLISGKEGKEEEREKGTAKGVDFEDLIFDEMNEICAAYKDIVTNTSKIRGVVDDKGDIVIDIEGNPQRRLVIECKDDNSYAGSIPKLRAEMEGAIKNREAEYGIWVFKKGNQLPRQYDPIKITNKYVISSYENYGIKYVFRLARTLVSAKNDGNVEVDIEEIKIEIEQFREKLRDFNVMFNKITNIENSADYLRKKLDQMKKDIEDTFDKIEKSIS